MDNPGETTGGSGTSHNCLPPTQGNGIVERFHRQLKAALKACLVGPAWMDELPLVLLGLRSAPKEGFGCAPAELVFSTTIRLPGEVFEYTPAAEPDMSDLLTHLRNTMARLRPKQTSYHRRPSTHIPVELQNCTFVFFVMTLIAPPCNAPMMAPSKCLSEPKVFHTRPQWSTGHWIG